MQFIQPNGFQAPYGQPPYPYNAPTPNQCNGYPDIIGEGNVTSTVSPDGTTQFIFLPTAQWWRPFYPNSNLNNPYMSDLGAWIVRSIYNPLPPAVPTQPYQTPYNIPYSTPSPSANGLNFHPQGFQLKFHNDNCTSTSDLHYFTPKQRNLFQKPQEYAGVQVEMPAPNNTVCHYGFICNQPCLCNPVPQCSHAPKNNMKRDVTSEMSIGKSKFICKCAKKDKHKPVKCMCITSDSEMSTEESQSDMIYDKVYKKGTRNKSRKPQIPKQKSSSVNCNRAASDKFVATYSDQGTAYRPEKCRHTQTDCSSESLCYTCQGEVKSNDTKQGDTIEPQKTPTKCDNIERSGQPTKGGCDSECRFGSCTCKKYTTELWMPATPMSKKDMKTDGLSDDGWCPHCDSETYLEK